MLNIERTILTFSSISSNTPTQLFCSPMTVRTLRGRERKRERSEYEHTHTILNCIKINGKHAEDEGERGRGRGGEEGGDLPLGATVGIRELDLAIILTVGRGRRD